MFLKKPAFYFKWFSHLFDRFEKDAPRFKACGAFLKLIMIFKNIFRARSKIIFELEKIFSERMDGVEAGIKKIFKNNSQKSFFTRDRKIIFELKINLILNSNGSVTGREINLKNNSQKSFSERFKIFSKTRKNIFWAKNNFSARITASTPSV